MPSPFPGMNPYLEQADVWQDFHNGYLLALRRQLVAQISGGLVAKVEETVYVHQISEGDDRLLLGRPDVAVFGETEGAGGGSATLEAPTWADLLPDQDVLRLPRIEVRDRLRRGLVTVIELLSPTNKRAGADRQQYLGKRRALLRSPAHLMEIDLLRGGERLPMRGLVDCDYCVLVSHAEQRPRVGVWPLRLRDPLPEVPVPLTPDHPPVTLDLMAALHQAYDEAGYTKYIYDGEPDPLLHPDDAKWAEQRLNSAA